MICVTIAQTSRRLALADMLNAAMLGGDLLEIRLDCFENEPDFKELLNARRKPVIFSCRRTADGGNWSGSDEARVMLLKTAIISGADYCELEADAAAQIRRFGSCKRVIAYTNLKETPADIGEIYEELKRLDPDIIKLTCRARTPEEAWPLVQLSARPTIPTVVVGLGRQGLMLTILGRKMGSPFALAALERGMEAYPGQPTVGELESVYHFRSIEKSTKLLGVTGLGERAFLSTAMLNASFAQLNVAIRCLPLQVGNVKLFRKIIEAVKLVGVVIEDEQQDALRDVATELDDNAKPAQMVPDALPVESAVDLLVAAESKQWIGTQNFAAGAVRALEATLQASGRSLEGAIVLFVGLTAASRTLARAIKEKGGRLIFASQERDVAAKFSRMLGGRHLQWEAVYSTLHDVLVVSPEANSSDDDDEKRKIHPGYLKAGMTVMDLTDLPRTTPLLAEATSRGCNIVSPQAILVEHVRSMVQRLTGQQVSPASLQETLSHFLHEE